MRFCRLSNSSLSSSRREVYIVRYALTRIAGASARRRSTIRSVTIIMGCLLVPCLQCVCYREALLHLCDLMGQSIQHALHCASRVPCANIRPIWLLVLPIEWDL